MTQLEAAREGILTPEMMDVAEKEGIDPQDVLSGVREGTIVIPRNTRRRGGRVVGIGAGLSTKVNANVGTAEDFGELTDLVAKLEAAVGAGADTVMDLSTGPDMDGARREVVARAGVPVGSVPLYQAAIEAIREKGSSVEMSGDDMLEAVERHARDGVDFVTVHCGVTLDSLGRLKRQGRVVDIVSRGGAFLAAWMIHHRRENPLFARFDELLEIAAAYDLTLSLGDGMRPGCGADATDRAQVQELLILGELVDRARRRGVQAMVEGPGHVPLDQVEASVLLEKKLCRGAPFYVLGPLVTDIAPGYDHIAAAIGGAMAAAAGADFLCYVTPAEHIGLPSVADVREGVYAARIAAHAADLVKGVARARAWDDAMSRARKSLDWEGQISLALDPEKLRWLRREKNPGDSPTCSMCGPYCAMKLVAEYLGKDRAAHC